MQRSLPKKNPDYKKERCAKCKYRGMAGKMLICEYYIITGQRREKTGENCDKFTPGRKIAVKD